MKISNQPLALVTVSFWKPLTGTQVLAMVRSVVGNNTYEESRRYADGDLILPGQSSSYPFKHVAVVGALNEPYLRNEQSYESVLIVSCSWPRSVNLIGYGDDDVIASVKEFASKLDTATRTESL